MARKSNPPPAERLGHALNLIRLRAQVRLGKDLTNGELAELAGVGERSFGDWMRGTYAPAGVVAIFELLSFLSENEVTEVLNYWRLSSIEKKPALALSPKKQPATKNARTGKGAGSSKTNSPRKAT
jgi:hypothetical protein